MRTFSIYVTRLMIKAGVRPNQVTGAMIIIGLVGAAVLALPGFWAALGAFVLVQIYLCLDCVDGEVARWTAETSAAGIYLDRLGHYLVESGLMVAIGFRADLPLLGAIAAIFVILEKAETDLVGMARAQHGLPAPRDDAALMNSPRLAGLRSLAARFPIHLATHAAEATLLALVAAAIDVWIGELQATVILAYGLAAIAGMMVVLHLISVINSGRLK